MEGKEEGKRVPRKIFEVGYGDGIEYAGIYGEGEMAKKKIEGKNRKKGVGI